MPRVSPPSLPVVLSTETAVRQILRAWAPDLYADPVAEASAASRTLGRKLAKALAATQGLYVFDHRAKALLFVSEGISRLLGCPLADVQTITFFYDRTHPDDLAPVTEATVLFNRYVQTHGTEDLRDVVASVDYRLRHQAGHYVRVLRQNLVLEQDEQGAVVAVAGILTDITAHKHTLDVNVHLNRPDFPAFLAAHRQTTAVRPLLSAREQQVLRLLMQGHRSQDIADALKISLHTVGTHRRNITAKTGTHDWSTLLGYLAPAG